MNWVFLREISWHLFIAAILGPFLVCLIYAGSRIVGDSWLDESATVILSALGVMVFGAPIIFVFVVVTLPLLFQVVKCRSHRSRTMAFSVAGAFLGFIVGIWIIYSELDDFASWILAMGVVLVGLICGYLDSLAWRDENTDANKT